MIERGHIIVDFSRIRFGSCSRDSRFVLIDFLQGGLCALDARGHDCFLPDERTGQHVRRGERLSDCRKFRQRALRFASQRDELRGPIQGGWQGRGNERPISLGASDCLTCGGGDEILWIHGLMPINGFLIGIISPKCQ